MFDNIVTFVFLSEYSMKIVAKGFKLFLKDTIDVIDFVVNIVALVNNN